MNQMVIVVKNVEMIDQVIIMVKYVESQLTWWFTGWVNDGSMLD